MTEIAKSAPRNWKEAEQQRTLLFGSDEEPVGYRYSHGPVTVQVDIGAQSITLLNARNPDKGIILQPANVIVAGDNGTLSIGLRRENEVYPTELASVKGSVITDLRPKESELEVIEGTIVEPLALTGATNPEAERLRAELNDLKEAQRRQRELLLTSRQAVHGPAERPVRSIPQQDHLPETAGPYYFKARALIYGPVGSSQYPHPTWEDDLEHARDVRRGKAERAARLVAGIEPGKDRGWADRKDLRKLIVDWYPGNYERDGRLPLGKFEGSVLAALAGISVLVAGRTGAGKTSGHLHEMVASWQGLLIDWELKGKSVEAIFDARAQWKGGVQIWTPQNLEGRALEKFGGYRATWPIMERFETWQGSIEAIDDLVYDNSSMMLGGNGGGSDSGFWVPQASNVAAAIGHTIAKSGGDIRDFVDAVGTIRAGIERSKENKNTKSTEIGEVIKLDDPVKEKIEGLLDMMRSDTDAAINMLNADMIRLAQRPAARANVVEITRLHAEIKKFEENRQGYHEAYRTIDKWGGLHEKTADIISAFAVTILDTFQGEQILNATSRSDNMIDTTDLQPRTVILYGTEDQQKRYGAILRLMHNSFARSVEEKHNSTLETVTPYVGFIRNEHGNAAPLNRLMEHITTGREIGIVHALDIQLGAQVIAQYGHEGLQALISCCDLILRKGSDPDIVDEVIKILGTVDVWRSNDKDPDDLLAKFGGVLLGQSGNTDNEERVTEPELKRNDIRDLNPNDAVLVHEGGTVAMIQGQPYHTNKRVKRIPMAREIGPEIVLPTGQRIRGGVLYEPGQVPAPRELNQSNKDDQPELEGNGKLAIEPVADRLALEPKRWRPAFKFGLRRAQVDPEEKEKDNDTSIDTQ